MVGREITWLSVKPMVAAVVLLRFVALVGLAAITVLGLLSERCAVELRALLLLAGPPPAEAPPLAKP